MFHFGYYYTMNGTNLTNGTDGGFTVIWSVVLQEMCREDDSNTESFSSGEYNVRYTTKLDTPLPSIEEAASAYLRSPHALDSERVPVLYSILAR